MLNIGELFEREPPPQFNKNTNIGIRCLKLAHGYYRGGEKCLLTTKESEREIFKWQHNMFGEWAQYPPKS